jgi:hypothetical protein
MEKLWLTDVFDYLRECVIPRGELRHFHAQHYCLLINPWHQTSVTAFQGDLFPFWIALSCTDGI